MHAVREAIEKKTSKLFYIFFNDDNSTLTKLIHTLLNQQKKPETETDTKLSVCMQIIIYGISHMHFSLYFEVTLVAARANIE